MNKMASIALILTTALGLQSCKTVQPQAGAAAVPEQTQPTTTALTGPEITTGNGRFSNETLYSLLVAEVAASRQQFARTLENYTEQAKLTQDPHITARAARIAQFFRAKEESLSMGLMWLEHEPNNIEALTLVANAQLESGEPLKALDYTERLLRLTQEDTGRDGGALIETIANFSKQADNTSVNTLIERLSSLQQQYQEVTGIAVGLSILYQTQGEYTQAKHWIQQALTQEPQRTSAQVQQIVLLQATGETDSAIKKLQTQLDKDPSNSRLRLLYARLLTRVDVKEAYEQFTQLSQQSPNQLDLKFSRALLAVELQNATVAKTLLEELLSVSYRENTTRFYLGHTYELLKQDQQALASYLAVTGGDNQLAALNRAGRLLVRQGSFDEAKTLFTQLRTNNPAKAEQLYVNESDVLVRVKAWPQALVLLDDAIAQYPDNASLRYNRSTVYEQQDQLILMESDLRHILALDPNNVDALNGLGYFLANRTDRYEEALELIQQALSLRPEDAAIIDSMGWVNFKLGRIDEAIAHLRRAFASFPDPEVAAHLGEALWVDGQHQEARDIWQKSLDDHPDSPYVKETIQRLEINLNKH